MDNEQVNVGLAVYGTAKQVFSSREDEVLYCGPAGTGKSYACLLKVHLFALRNPGARIMLIRKTLVSLTNTGVVTYKEQIAKDMLESGDITYFGGSAQESAAFIYPNGAKVLLGGMDNPMKIMSAEYDLMYIQEATELTEDAWEKCTTRLRNGKTTMQQLLADCNPQMPTHWLKKRCDKGLTKIINSRHEDNPTLFDQDTGEMTEVGKKYIGKLDRLTGVRHARLRKGIWAAADGLVYDLFDPTIHVLPADFKIPQHWKRWWTIDFGFTNPFVLQMWAEDEDGRLYLYKEIYWTKRNIMDQARFLMNHLKHKDTGLWKEPRPRAIVADHDAGERSIFTKQTGLGTTAAKKDILIGIQEAQERFKVQDDGKPRIFFLQDAVIERDPALDEAGKPCSTLEEIVGYIWDKNKETVVGKPEKEMPVGEDDHGMDAMRYMCMKRAANRGMTRLRYLG